MTGSKAKATVFQNYIDGNWIAAADGRTFEQRNPANLDEVTGLWPACTAEDARRAIGAAEAAFRKVTHASSKTVSAPYYR